MMWIKIMLKFLRYWWDWYGFEFMSKQKKYMLIIDISSAIAETDFRVNKATINPVIFDLKDLKKGQSEQVQTRLNKIIKYLEINFIEEPEFMKDKK